MKLRAVGGVVTVAGIALLVVSVRANHLGIGSSGSFGWKQTTGAIFGGAIVVVGLAVLIEAVRVR